MSESLNQQPVEAYLPADSKIKPTPTHSRDPQYYFEDGSVVLLVEDVLFKIHASLVKAESQVFQDMLAMPSGDSAGTDGTSDQRPIVIPQVEPKRFRNLMKMFYCPPSSRFFVSLRGDDPAKINEAAWDNFQFYLDVARLSHRFAMVDMEQWASSQLTLLISSLGEKVINRSQWGHLAVLVFLDAIEYAQIIQDRQLTNELKSLVQYHLSRSEWTTQSESLKVFRIPDLRVKHPSLFGLLFVLFLSDGRASWSAEAGFTKIDRVAFYSGLVNLTPFPESFKTSIRSPLFSKPTKLDDFRKQFVSDPSKPVLPAPCAKGCDKVIMDIWFQQFGDAYYKNIASEEIRGPAAWLSTLYDCRYDWAKNARMKLKPGECHDCYVRYIDQMDQDLELLFTRAGEYYRDIE